MLTLPNIEHVVDIEPRSDLYIKEAGRQHHGQLWSSLAGVCALLRISISKSISQEEYLFQHMRLRSGQILRHEGYAFEVLYIVNSGFLKKILIDEFGNEQVVGFPMVGDIIGADGLNDNSYASDVVALSDCDLIVLPLNEMNILATRYPQLEGFMYNILSREIVREQILIGMIASLDAEARVARFLIDLSCRFEEMGYSGREFYMRMSRTEIGSYLCLTMETVSRTLSSMNESGVIAVYLREIRIIEIDRLRVLGRLPSETRKGKSTPLVTNHK